MAQELWTWLCFIVHIVCVVAQTDELISSSQCITNYDCDKQQACIDLICKNPCPGICTGNATCEIHEHVSYCACKSGYTGNPFTGCSKQNTGNSQNCTEKNQQAIQRPPGVLKSYSIGTEQLNWYQALADCFSRGMRLATVENDQEYNHLVYLLKLAVEADHKTDTSFWLSGTDLTQNGTYVWMSTGQPMTYTQWYRDEPSHNIIHEEVERCIEIWGLFNYKMNDARCSLRQWYICEKV